MEINTKRDSSRFTDRHLFNGEKSGIKKRKKKDNKKKDNKKKMQSIATQGGNKQSFFSEKSKHSD